MTFLLDPNAVLDFEIDFTQWLATGETIVSTVIEADEGVTVAPEGRPTTTGGGVVTVWLTGGTVGAVYDVTCRISTTAGRTDDRTIRVRSYQR